MGSATQTESPRTKRGYRRCLRCGESKPKLNFPTVGNFIFYCCPCVEIVSNAQSPVEVRRLSPGEQHSARVRRLEFHYKLTEEKHNALLSKQGGCCGICGSPSPGGNRRHFHVDHDHVSGRVRGLLCNNCNSGLGLLGDSEDNLLKAVEYLKHNLSEGVL